MKKHSYIGVALALALAAQYAPEAVAQTLPDGKTSWSADNGNGTFTNPLFYDEFSDPDILRVGDDYYLAGTTMHTVPGVVILHSKDLVNWENISYCMPRFDFGDDRFSLKNKQEIYGQGVWAPCIRYSNGKFYVFTNVNGKGLQCFMADKPEGPWTHSNMKGRIYDLSVLFDDDGKIYAIHGYGDVKCTELKPDMSAPIDETTRTIIPEGNSVGEGHHIYKINGMYYLISTDYMPNGRTLCSRSKSIWGPYETRVIEADETYGYHNGFWTKNTKQRIPDENTAVGVADPDVNATGCANAHQGGIVQTPDGKWWALLMQDFHSIGRTVCLMPMTWKDGWPMVGLEGNLGRAPRTWFKPQTTQTSAAPHAPYVRSDNFDGGKMNRIWQWNHNPEESKWSLTEKKGVLRLHTMPAKEMMWARNTLTQRVVGPSSVVTVELGLKGLKDGDMAGLGNVNKPCSWLGVAKDGKELSLKWYDQNTNQRQQTAIAPKGNRIWLRMDGKYDDNVVQYSYSTDGKNFTEFGQQVKLGYQLVTFQGSRASLFAYNTKDTEGGYADFDNFTVVETEADRSQNLPLGKTFAIKNLGRGDYMEALPHGLMHGTKNRNAATARFKFIDRGQGKVLLQCTDGRYVFIAGEGLPGDVRFTTDETKATEFLFQDYLNHQFMLLSLSNNRYVGMSPTTGSSYSCDYRGADPARTNGAVFEWEE